MCGDIMKVRMMTLSEFKAWLEGFEAAMTEGSPSPDQWATIKAKLGRVQITHPLPPTRDKFWEHPSIRYEAR